MNGDRWERDRVVIDLEGVSCDPPGGQAVRDITLPLLRGKTYALCGDRGAARTYMDLIGGVRTHNEGLVDVHDRSSMDPRLFQAKFDTVRRLRSTGASLPESVWAGLPIHPGLLFQQRGELPVLPLDCRTLGTKVWKQRVSNLYRKMRRAPYWDSSYGLELLDRFGLEKRSHIRKLSKKQQQLLAGALGLAWHPQVVVIDAAAPELNAGACSQLLSATIGCVIADRTTLVFTSRSDDQVRRMADYVVTFRQGRIISVELGESEEEMPYDVKNRSASRKPGHVGHAESYYEKVM
jgi:ABC-type multidrug transport system ATPase subunit